MSFKVLTCFKVIEIRRLYWIASSSLQRNGRLQQGPVDRVSIHDCERRLLKSLWAFQQPNQDLEGYAFQGAFIVGRILRFDRAGAQALHIYRHFVEN